MAGRTIVDAGWAPEIKPFLGTEGADMFVRLAKEHCARRAPRCAGCPLERDLRRKP